MAGSAITFTETRVGTVKKIKCAWTSDDTTNAVSGTTTYSYSGRFIGAITVPGTVGDQPDNLYDIEIVDYSEATTLDLALGALADRSNTTTQFVAEASMAGAANTQLTFSITNAGASNKGTIYLLIR